MERFDPAINYGPNDAGVTGLSIILVAGGTLIALWLFNWLYGLFVNRLQSKEGQDKDRNQKS